MNILNQQKTQSMTSQQIADLVGSRHDNVKRTILSLNTAGVIQLPQREEVKNDRGQTVVLFRFAGEQGRIDSIIVVAQLSPEFTAALVKRWDELEKGAAQPTAPAIELPKDYLSALKALVTSEEA